MSPGFITSPPIYRDFRLVIKPGTERNEMERNETKRNGKEWTLEYDETSGPSLRLGGHIQPDCRQSVTLANSEYNPAGLNPMLRVLF